MKYKLKAYSILEYGQRKDAAGKPHQEDCLFPTPKKLNNDARLYVLCDGMGGHDAGEVASATVCEALGNTILNDVKHYDFDDEVFNHALSVAYDALDTEDQGSDKKMGTTMTMLCLHSEGATIAHIGDSRVYHIRPGTTGEDTQILFETEDHSLINALIKIGEMTKEEALHSNQKNVITRAMQPNLEKRHKADIHHISDILPGDYFFLCSDGMLEDPEMESGEILRNVFSALGGRAKKKAKILKKITEDNSDNHSAFIIQITDVKD